MRENGKPKLRIVEPYVRRPHGALKGAYKYIDPNSGKPMPFYVLEMWMPPDMCGGRDTWNYDLLGPYPADCWQECCDGGFWGFKLALASPFGEYIPITDKVIDFIQERHDNDIKWSLMSEVQRLEALNEQKLAADKRADAENWATQNEWADTYATYKEKEDAADTRVTVAMGKNAISDRVKGGKEAIGHPKLII